MKHIRKLLKVIMLWILEFDYKQVTLYDYELSDELVLDDKKYYLNRKTWNGTKTVLEFKDSNPRLSYWDPKIHRAPEFK